MVKTDIPDIVYLTYAASAVDNCLAFRMLHTDLANITQKRLTLKNGHKRPYFNYITAGGPFSVGRFYKKSLRLRRQKSNNKAICI